MHKCYICGREYDEVEELLQHQKETHPRYYDYVTEQRKAASGEKVNLLWMV